MNRFLKKNKYFTFEVIFLFILLIATFVSKSWNIKIHKFVFHEGLDAVYDEWIKHLMLTAAVSLLYRAHKLFPALEHLLKNRMVVIPKEIEEKNENITESLNTTTVWLGRIFDQIKHDSPQDQELHSTLLNISLSRIFDNGIKGEFEYTVLNIEDQNTQQQFFFKNFLLECAKKSQKIAATCITSMDSFWFIKDIGSTFFSMNLDYLDLKKPIERIFLVRDDEWDKNDIKKRELIKLMVCSGMDCYTVQSTEINFSIQDLFVFYIGDKPYMALEWEVNNQNWENKVKMIYHHKRLADIHDSYNRLNTGRMQGINRPKHIKPEIFAKEFIYLPKTTIGRKNYIDNLSSDRFSKNSYNYIKHENIRISKENISEYWGNLRGTIVRPSQSSLKFLHEKLEQFKVKDTKMLNIGILGCTPEVVKLINDLYIDSSVYYIDLSNQMYEGMNEFIKSNQLIMNNRIRENTHLRYNWLSLDLIPEEANFKLDIIIGIDVLNVLHGLEENYELFFKGLKHITTPSSRIFLQTLCYDPIQNPFRKLSIEDGRRGIKETEKLSPSEKINKFNEYFIRMALIQDKANNYSRILDIPGTFSRISEYDHNDEPILKEFSLFIENTYKYCNSYLTTFDKNHEFHSPLLDNSLEFVGSPIHVNDEGNFSTEYMYLMELRHSKIQSYL